MATERDNVMIISGCFTEERVIRGVKDHDPNRFYGEGEAVPSPDDGDYLRDATGYISLEGKRTPVLTGFWGGAEIWKLDTDSPAWPKCPTCGNPLDIGSALIWECYTCNPTPMMRKAVQVNASVTAL